MKYYFYQALEENPIIAAIKNMDDLELCCSLEEIRVVFVLFGDICTIRTIVKRLKDAGKIAIVHVDLIVGLSSKEIVVDFIKMSTEADGIISTKVPLIRRGNELNFITVQRCFLLDSMAYENLRQQQHQVKPDYIEVLPGIMPITTAAQMKRSQELSGTVFPRRFLALLDRFGDYPDAMKQAGIAYATDQIIDLLANGVKNIHVYSMNKPEVAAKIMENLSEVIKC